MSETAQELYVDLVKQADATASEKCCRISSNYDFNGKLNSFGISKPDDMRVTVLHGVKDHSIAPEASSGSIKDLIHDIDLNVFDNGAHELYHTFVNELMMDILAQLN